MRPHEIHFKLHEAELPLKNKVHAIHIMLLDCGFKTLLAMLCHPLQRPDTAQASKGASHFCAHAAACDFIAGSGHN